MRWLLFALVIALSACSDLYEVKDVEVRTGDPEFALPLLSSTFTLQKIFEQSDIGDTELLIYPDSSVSLIYTGDVLTRTAPELFEPIFGYIPLVVQKEMDTIPMPFDRIDILRAVLMGDSLVLNARSSLPMDVNVHIEFISLEENGKPLSVDIPLDYDGELPVENAAIFDMEGMVMTPYENNLIIHYEATDENGNPVDLDYVRLIWNEMSFFSVQGYFSKNDVNIPGDFIDIEVYDNWINGRLYFEKPTVEVRVENSFGFPVRADIHRLRFIGRQGQEVDLESPQNDSINFDFPDLTEIGEVKKNIIVYDGDNSNIEDIINIQPVRLEYDIDGVGNPDEDSTLIGFFTDSSYVRINVGVELPVSGWANNFTSLDTLDFDIGDLDDVRSAELKMVFDNGMPLQLTAQLSLMDENYEFLDSMFLNEPLIVASSDIDNDGLATNSVRTIRLENFSDARMEKLEQTKYAILEIGFLTNGAPNRSIRIDAYDALEFRMGAKLKFE